MVPLTESFLDTFHALSLYILEYNWVQCLHINHVAWVSCLLFTFSQNGKKKLSCITRRFSSILSTSTICGLINSFHKNTVSRLTCSSSLVLFCSCFSLRSLVAQLHPIKFRRQGAWLESEWRHSVCRKSRFTLQYERVSLKDSLLTTSWDEWSWSYQWVCEHR